jgi:predicted transcriptional regulator YheO
MSNNPLLDPYKPLVPFLAALCGDSCEVLLHDISQPKHSVIAIANGFHTGRTVGSPFTDLALKIIDEKQYKDADYLTNYSGKTKGKNFVSSSFFIKHKGKLIGLLCINREMDTINALDNALALVKKHYNLEEAHTEVQESLDVPVSALLSKMVSDEIKATGIQPDRMNRNERAQVIHNLMEAGVHNMKGAVIEIAKQLDISEPTVYRYIKKHK